MPKPDLHATLKAIAAGKATGPTSARGAPVVTRESVERDQKAFAAWSAFVRSIDEHAGEPLAAPSATLTPLP
jgi:hypothetical protein